ncbi:hypothetical protein KOI35_18415 [Actinoplanes bogorensis]|uniref:Lipoprotein n=1 Tax=Paractinoplanes bogorensis TaxID=1610840 RepID=A0ABS5YPV6_9ACTN|nr:hypothetical protein [Actinoplanes bogorensis]MBU2665485.1 hypothetical protein [Actinoplanes bogorensis]
MWRRVVSWVVLVGTSALFTGCTASDEVEGGASPVPPSSLPVLASPDAGRELVRVTDHTGSWSQSVGGDEDTGAVDFSVTCVGGGFLVVTYRVAGAAKALARMPCDGGEVSRNRDDSIGPGPITVTVEPDGDQRWSAVVARATG